MSSEKNVLSITRDECPKCGAIWLNGQHYWATGVMGNEIDLAGLVCNNFGDNTCINSCKGITGGDTWEKRFQEIDSLIEDMKKNQ